MSKDTPSTEENLSPAHLSVTEEQSLFDAAAELLRQCPSSETETLQVVANLLEGLGKGAVESVDAALARLQTLAQPEVKESDLFRQVGAMTRSLHNSLEEFRSSLDPQGVTMTSTNLPDAADKLEQVLESTRQATDETLATIEAQQELMAEAKETIDNAEAYLNSCPDSEMKTRMQEFIQAERLRCGKIHALTDRTLHAQEFQDLTGQALQKVISLVTNLEENMVSIIRVFGLPESKKEDPQEKESLEQDNVDDLLSSLGF